MTHMSFLGWFRRDRDTEVPRGEWWERLGQLESAMKQLQLEWSETYETVNRQLRKLSKREQRALQEKGDEVEATPEPVPPNGDLHALRAQARARGWRV